MKGDDLTQVKNIGSARMKLLNSQGITTIQQLYDIPLEKLEQVKGLGQHYAKLIKQSVNDLYAEKAEPPEKSATEISPSEPVKIDKTDRNLNAELAKTTKYLKTAREKLKPIQKKKHIKLFVDLKKCSNKLKTRMIALSQIQPDFSEKKKKKIIKKATILNSKLKSVGKSKKGKAMKMLANEIQSFSKTIRQ
jgi:hypothetical protein